MTSFVDEITGDTKTLHQRLKAATSRLHHEAEVALDIAQKTSNQDDYVSLLKILWHFHTRYELALTNLDLAAYGIDVPARKKSHWLAEDLQYLRVQVPDLTPSQFSTDEPFGALGCLYVIEGSMLGGQIIAQKAARTLKLTPARGARFFHGYGNQTGPMWQSFLKIFNDFSSREPAADIITRGARNAFEDFISTVRPLNAAIDLTGAKTPDIKVVVQA